MIFLFIKWNWQGRVKSKNFTGMKETEINFFPCSQALLEDGLDQVFHSGRNSGLPACS